MAHVTIPDQDTFVTYTVTGSTTGPFIVPFAVFAKADITVLKDGVDLGQAAFSYTPTSSTTGGYQTGTISLGSAVEDCEITLYRSILPVRTSDMGPGPKDRDADNTQWDRFQAQLQDARRALDRAFKADFGDTPAAVDLTAVAAVAAISSAVEQVADIDAEVVIVADAMADVEIVADNIADVGTVADTINGVGLTTGTGAFVRATSPTLVTPALGTPASGNLMNCNVVRSCANNAALRALVSGTGLLNGALYETAARTSDNDGGGGRYLYSSSDQSSLLVRSTKTVSAVDTGADTLTVTAHGFYTGRAVIASAADAGLSLNTLYYVAVVDANTLSLHTTRANAFAGTSKVDITALAGSLSLKLLADPGQGIYVIPTGAALDGSGGCFIRQSGDLLFAAWFGMWASASAATNTQAIYDAWQACALASDSNAQLSWGSTIVLADGSCTLADETITLDGKGGIIAGGDNTKLTGTYTSSKAAFIIGSSAYVAGVGLGYFAVRLESFGTSFTSHGYCFRSYIRCFQARDIWTANASISDYDIHGAWNLGQIVDCHGQGGTGRWLTLSDESNHFTVENNRAIFYTATWTIHVTGCYAPKIHQNDIEYNTGGIYLVSSAATRVDSAQVSENWFEGDTSKALLLDNTDYSVENFRMEGNTIYGFTADATSGVVEIGVSGGAGIIDNPLVEGNSFLGPSTTQLQFNSAAAKYTNVSYNINARNAFTGGAAISFATRPEIETYPIPRSYTCTLGGSGSPTIGDGTLTGEFTRIGNMVEYRIVLTVGSTTSFGSGAISFSIPYVAAALGGGNEQYFGKGYYFDSGTSEAWSLVSTVYSGGSALFPVRSTGGGVTATAPITIATGDQFQFFGRYRAVNL